ncbi:MAG: hypothetical protein ABIH23_24135, partial [bacterium]
MRRTILIPLVVLFAALGLVGFVLLSGVRPHGPAYRLAALPTPELIAPVRTPAPDTSTFLECFPDIGMPTVQQVAEQLPTPEPVSETPAAEPTPPQEVSMEKSARSVLISLLLDWHYVNYTLIASKKSGMLENFKTNDRRAIWEGMKMERDVLVASLSEQSAVMQLDDATFELRLVERPSFFDRLAEKRGPLTPEEQQEGLEYYMKVYG